MSHADSTNPSPQDAGGAALACPATACVDSADDHAPAETEDLGHLADALQMPTSTDERDHDPAHELAAADASPVAASLSAKLVPVTEAIRYRKRAQAAEQQLTELRTKLSAAETDLSRTRQTIAVLERRQKIDALLADSDAVDVEVARLLTEAAVEVMDTPDVAAAIADLRRSKPYLFRNRRTEAGAMPARTRGPSQTVITAAEQAASTGDRHDLLRYLRLRRNGNHAVA